MLLSNAHKIKKTVEKIHIHSIIFLAIAKYYVLKIFFSEKQNIFKNSKNIYTFQISVAVGSG